MKYRFLHLLAVLLLLATSLSFLSPTTVQADSPETYQPSTKDNYISEGSPTTNYGTDTHVDIRDWSTSRYRAIFEFDISSLPAGITITDATFSAYYYSKGGANPSTRQVNVYNLTQTNWTETGSCWDNYKASTAWTAAGGDYNASSIQSTTVPASYGWMSWTITNITHDAYTNSANVELLMRFNAEDKTSGTAARVYFYSRDYATNTTLRPKLVITYTVSGGTPVVKTLDATNIGSDYATLNGEVTYDGGGNVSARFNYGTTADLGSVTTWQANKVTNNTFNYDADSLTPYTTYYFRAEVKDGSNNTYNGTILTFLTSTYATRTLRDYYNTGDTSGTGQTYGVYVKSQVFTTSGTYDALSVKLKLYREGSPGIATIQLRTTTGGEPTATTVATATYDCDSLTTSTSGEWIEATFTAAYTVNASTQYAIVLSTGGSSGDSVHWRFDNAGSYSGGYMVDSTDGGSSWSTFSGYDAMFEVWGVNAGTGGTVTIPTISTTNAIPSSTSATLYGSIDDLGGATEAIERGFDCGSQVSPFTIIVIPDTQILSESHPTYFTAQTQWIKDNINTLNVKAVIHEGDIVNEPTSTTQWDRADAAMDILDGVIPYIIVPGNHDYTSLGGRDLTKYETYFGYSRFSGYDWYHGYTDNTNTNSYIRVSIGTGLNLLIIGLECFPTDTELTWASSVIEAYPTDLVIIVTHAYMDDDNTLLNNGETGSASYYGFSGADGEDGKGIWTRLISHYPQILMVTSGHVAADGLGQRVDYVEEEPIIQILVNYQNYSGGGQGYTRINTFDFSNNTLDATSYSPVTGTYKTDSQNQFTLTPRKSSSSYIGQSVTTIGSYSAGAFSLIVTGLTSDITYQYRAKALTTGGWGYGVIKSFTTGESIPPTLPTVFTGSATGITVSSATLQGTLTSLGNTTTVYVSFEYGTTTGYGGTTVEKTATSIGAFVDTITGLSSYTTYHFRAVVRYGASGYIYGADNTFTTTGVTSAVNAPTDFHISSRTTTSLTLSWTKGNGATSTVIRYSTDTYPISPTAGSPVYSGIGTSYTNTGLTEGTTYYYSAWGLEGSTYSSTYISTTGVPSADILAMPDTFKIETLQIYQDYVNPGDQIIVVSIEILWNAGQPIGYDPSDFFYFQLLDGNTIVKQDRIKLWGYVPGSLYISNITPIIWGKDYTFRLIGTSKWAAPPSTTYSITSTNYMGSNNMNLLANWVLELANRMQTSGYWDTLIEVSGATRLLNNEAYQIFTTAIPGIAEAVPSLFFMTDTARTYTAATTDEAFLNSLKENAETSHGEAFWRPIKEAANVLGVDTAVTATGAWIILWLVVAMIIWLAMRDILIAATISLIVPLIGVQFGGINGTYLAIAIAVLAMGWGYNLWLRKT